MFAWYLLKHKFWVIYYAFILFPGKIPLFQLFYHDLDKLYGFKEYARAFNEQRDIGFAHRISQKHHWEYWSGQIIPSPYKEEMMVDWLAASKTKGHDLVAWYQKHHEEINLSPETRRYAESILLLYCDL